ncbi:MAG: hypothetical protein CMJ18_09725, partial [Phycisphaeraceae bacterium]|nr:hypothetical protein [Phycisphaeraceae bacterium]
PPSNGRSRDGGAAPYRAETLRRPVTTGFDLKAFAVPVLLTVGLLLLIPAVWGTLLLAGFEVWASGREGAVTMAKAMLVCWPIALVLLGSAAFYAMQLRRERAAR